MGIRDYAREQRAMRAPSVRVPYDGSETVVMVIDAGQTPRRVALHDLGKRGKRSCQPTAEGGCQLCRAVGEPDISHVVDADTVTADGVPVASSLWLRGRELGRLAGVLPDGGVATVAAAYLAREGGELRDDGQPWRDLAFVALALADGSVAELPAGWPAAPALDALLAGPASGASQ